VQKENYVKNYINKSNGLSNIDTAVNVFLDYGEKFTIKFVY